MKPFMLYLVGRSGSGKSTIAEALHNELSGKVPVQLMDGDTLRNQLGNMFGYTREERLKNNRVVRVIISYLLSNGISVILSQVAAYQEMRDIVRSEFAANSNYIEAYVKCSLEECQRRDVKGYYKADIDNLNGKNDSFEEPVSSDIVLNTEKYSLKDEVKILKDYIAGLGYHV